MTRNGHVAAHDDDRLAVDAEQQLLGMALVWPEETRDAVLALTPEQLTRPRHAAVLRALQGLYRDGRDIGPLTVYDALSADSGVTVDEVYDLADIGAQSAGSRDCVRMIRAAAQRRALAAAAADVAARLADGDDADAVLAAAQTRFAAVAAVTAPEPLAVPLADGLLSQRPPPREYLLRLPTIDGQPAPPRAGDGWLPGGVVGVISSAGGTGKTQLLLSLAVAVITGRDWLGLSVSAQYVGRRVLLLLAEETPAEVHRRLWAVAESMGLDDAERRLVERRLVVAALAARPCALVTVGDDGRAAPTAAYDDVRRLVCAADEPWGLVVVDPLARFAPAAESASDAATLAVQLLEALAGAPGEPATLLSHHSSKVSRRADSADARGVTALTDAARWAATLLTRGDDVTLTVTKSNYSRPADPIVLRREPGGTLRRVAAEELAAAEAAAADAAAEAAEETVAADARRVVDAVRARAATGETTPARRVVGTWARLRAARARDAIDYAVAAGWLRCDGYRGPYVVVDPS